MSNSNPTPVTARHLERNAYLYVRQSTLRQVMENCESTQRQYALGQRAIALGWRAEQVIVIDRDLGQSAAGTADRQGFQELVAEVGLGRAGIVLGLEVSRLARNSSDWHKLLEICGMSDTLILDEDGIYDPSSFNDRLLLGLKGTMSEAELHVLRARLRGGVLNKARRGELRTKLPIGLVWDPSGRIVLDPDAEVRASVTRLFETFERVGTASATVKDFQRNGHLFPVRHPNGPNTDELQWKPLVVCQALHVLHNPRYTGTYVYGRRRERSRLGGRKVYRTVPRSEWIVVIPNSHPGYITWETYLANEQRIRQNGLAYGLDRRTRTPREGPALLQGIVLCGKCGRRMWVSYQRHGGGLTPIYMCYDDANKFTQRICQRVAGTTLDSALGQLLIDEMTPTAMALCLAVQDEVRDRADQSSSLRELHVKRAQYEVDLARMRYLQVDPTNRLVADTLEADWNEKLRALQVARDEHERGCAKDQNRVNDAERALVLGLPSGFAEMWNDSATAHQVKKRIVRLLVDDVTLVRGEEVTMHVRLKGGVNRSLTLPVPLPYNDLRKTPVAVIELVDKLLSENTDCGVARELVRRGIKTGAGDAFSVESVKHIRFTYRLKCLRKRLRERGLLTQKEVERRLGVSADAVRALRLRGVLEARVGDDKSTWLYDPSVVERVAEDRRHERSEPTARALESLGQGAV